MRANAAEKSVLPFCDRFDRTGTQDAKMEDSELSQILKSMSAAIAGAQARNKFANYLLMEIVRDMANITADPQRYLAGLFERISARADQTAIEDEAHPVHAEFREVLAQFFAIAGRTVNRGVPPAV